MESNWITQVSCSLALVCFQSLLLSISPPLGPRNIMRPVKWNYRSRARDKGTPDGYPLCIINPPSSRSRMSVPGSNTQSPGSFLSMLGISHSQRGGAPVTMSIVLRRWDIRKYIMIRPWRPTWKYVLCSLEYSYVLSRGNGASFLGLWCSISCSRFGSIVASRWYLGEFGRTFKKMNVSLLVALETPIRRLPKVGHWGVRGKGRGIEHA